MRSRSTRSRFGFGRGAGVSAALPIWAENLGCVLAPVAVQEKLWHASHNSDYVANPEIGVGSLHSWGVAIDATLVDTWNRPVRMPSDFDDFTPAAMWRYIGPHPDVRAHVHLLQIAMRNAGFWGLRTEWWHFTIADWQKYLPNQAARTAQVSGTSGRAVMIDPLRFLHLSCRAKSRRL